MLSEKRSRLQFLSNHLVAKTLAYKIADKTCERYDDIIRLIRVKLSFLAKRAALLCLRGSRTMFNDKAELCTDFAHSLNELGLQ